MVVWHTVISNRPFLRQRPQEKEGLIYADWAGRWLWSGGGLVP